MPIHTRKLTDEVARSLPAPAAGYALHWCPRTPGLALRVTANGARAWIAERYIDGRNVRRTLGRADGKKAISADAARRLQITVSSELQQGVDRTAVALEKRQAEKRDAVTLGGALRNYVKTKRRGRDKLPLKERTRSDYLQMLDPPGEKSKAGALYKLASKPLHKISGDDIRGLFASLASRGERQQTYALQVVRAVLRHEGVTIEDNPLDPNTAGARRVALAPARGDPSPIPPEALGAWWRAACQVHTESGDMLRFMLLTGCRPGEAAKLLVGDFDLRGERVTLRDTKNRRDHIVLLAKTASAIVHWHAHGRKAKQPLFGVMDPGKTLAAINEAAGVERVTAHRLRHTFASIAAELVPAFTLRRLLNHAAGGDTAATHYVHVSDAQLRAAWQAVADHIERLAARR